MPSASASTTNNNKTKTQHKQLEKHGSVKNSAAKCSSATFSINHNNVVDNNEDIVNMLANTELIEGLGDCDEQLSNAATPIHSSISSNNNNIDLATGSKHTTAVTASKINGNCIEENNPFKKILVTIDHKIRNMEKRKTKLESYRELQASGKDLSTDQKHAVAKYDAVAATLDFAHGLSKQIMHCSKDWEKEEKKKSRKELMNKSQAETSKIREVLNLQNIVYHLKNDVVREDFRLGQNGATKLEQHEFEILDKFIEEVNMQNADTADDASFAQKVAELYSMTIDARTKQFHGVTFEYLHELFQKIQICGYMQMKTSENFGSNLHLPDYNDVQQQEPPQVQQLATQTVTSDIECEKRNQYSRTAQIQMPQAPPAAALPVFRGSKMSDESSTGFNTSAIYAGNVNANAHHLSPSSILSLAPMHGTLSQTPPPNHFNMPAPKSVYNVEQAFFNHQLYMQQMRPLAEVIGSSNFHFLQDSEVDAADLDVIMGNGPAIILEPNHQQQSNASVCPKVNIKSDEPTFLPTIPAVNSTNQAFTLVTKSNNNIKSTKTAATATTTAATTSTSTSPAIPVNNTAFNIAADTVITEESKPKSTSPQQQPLFSPGPTAMPHKNISDLLDNALKTCEQKDEILFTMPDTFPIEKEAYEKFQMQLLRTKPFNTYVATNTPLLLGQPENEVTTTAKPTTAATVSVGDDALVNAWDAPLKSALTLSNSFKTTSTNSLGFETSRVMCFKNLSNTANTTTSNRIKWPIVSVMGNALVNDPNNGWTVPPETLVSNRINTSTVGAFGDGLSAGNNHNWHIANNNRGHSPDTLHFPRGRAGGRSGSNHRRNDRNNTTANILHANAATSISYATRGRGNNNNNSNSNSMNYNNALAQNGSTNNIGGAGDNSRINSGVFFRNNDQNYFPNGNTTSNSTAIKEGRYIRNANNGRTSNTSSRTTLRVNNGNATTATATTATTATSTTAATANTSAASAYISPRQSYRLS